jgi:hypothetical protein
MIDLDYFNVLEEDLLAVARYVEFTPDNYKTYSVQFVRLLLAAGSEVDVACKALIRTFEPKAKPDNIKDYRKVLLRRFPEITEDVISCPRFGLKLHPWKGWPAAHPDWWRAYNSVKHDRIQNYEKANLENVLNATCGLGVVLQYFGQSFGPCPPKVFNGNLFRLHLITIVRPKGPRST